MVMEAEGDKEDVDVAEEDPELLTVAVAVSEAEEVGEIVGVVVFVEVTDAEGDKEDVGVAEEDPELLTVAVAVSEAEEVGEIVGV